MKFAVGFYIVGDRSPSDSVDEMEDREEGGENVVEIGESEVELRDDILIGISGEAVITRVNAVGPI